MNKIRWIIARDNEEIKENIVHQFGLDPIIARLLTNRGLQDTGVIEDFLDPRLENLINPFSLEGMGKAVRRIRQAFDNKEKILIYGDYDVDGITSTALLFSILKAFSTDIYYYIPDRSDEGYGISQKGIQFAIQYQISLIITVDCGITSHQEIQELSDLHIDTIVTDHHEPLKQLPKAFTIINPKSCDYPFKELAGVGVAFKLAQAIYASYGEKNSRIYQHLDLVALGTIADSVLMLGENRILVKYGLSRLVERDKVGLKTLFEHFEHRNFSHSLLVEELSFGLIPVLNSTGRIGNPHHAVDLLLTDSSYRAQFLVEKMLKLNDERKILTQKVLEEARKLAYEKNAIKKQKILILASDQWHPGVLGIVASKIMEEFLQPIIMISINGGIGKGSGRNQGEFDFSKILFGCSDLLIQYGGHQYAAGLTIDEENIDLFNQRINKIIGTDSSFNPFNEPFIQIDSIVGFEKISWDFLTVLEKFKPFGPGNPQPVFGGYQYPLVSWKRVGKDERHLKINLGKAKAESCIDGIAFQLGKKALEVIKDKNIDVAFHLAKNYWNGKESIQLMIKDIK